MLRMRGTRLGQVSAPGLAPGFLAFPRSASAMPRHTGRPTPVATPSTASPRPHQRSVITSVSTPSRSSSDVSSDDTCIVSIDNTSDTKWTIFNVVAADRPGLLTSITASFRDLNLEVGKATVNPPQGGIIKDSFWVCGPDGEKITDQAEIDTIKQAMELIIKQAKPTAATARPAFSLMKGDASAAERLKGLMGKAAALCPR